MKVVLIHGKYFNSWEAQGLGYIGAYLRKHLPGVELEFFQGCFDNEVDILQACRTADWALFSCTTPTYKWSASLAKYARSGGHTRTVIGGYHASAAPRQVGREFDYVVVGDGEQATLDIVTGGASGRFVLGRPMQFEELKWPDRKLIQNERNIQVAAKDNGKRITSFQAHRGCPFGCKFCADGARKVQFPDGRAVCRARPIADLLAEIIWVGYEYRLDFFKFCDATWNMNKVWVKQFCQTKMESRVDLPFFANIHAAHADEEMFALMAAAGCQQIGLGVESGSERILKSIGKRVTKDQIRQAAGWAKKHGIHVRGYFILGVPEETEADLAETEAFADELALDEYGFALLCPYPGTDYFYRYPELWDVDWSTTDEYANDFWHTETVSNGRLREVQARLVEKFRDRITQHQRQLTEEAAHATKGTITAG